MKKMVLLSVSAVLLLASCDTYTGAGAYTGSTFGSIIGSAIGGIAGGPRGSDIGTLIGMAGGAVVGAAVGSAADKAAEQQRYEDYQRARQDRQHRYDYQGNDVYDGSNGGDDRLYGLDENFGGAVTDDVQDIEIRNPRIIDSGRDGRLSRGEEARVVFEVYNNSTKPAYRIQPSVAEVTGNRHIRVSQNVLVESIMPGKGIRYTAVIKADDRLKDGEAVIRIGVLRQNKEITSQTRVFTIQTSKR